MKREPRSDILASVHEVVTDMYQYNAIDKVKMERFDLLCLKPVEGYDGKKIKLIRKRFNLSQVLLASALNISVSTVRQWEQGLKKPSGASQKLLSILDSHGLDPLVV